MKFGAKTLDLQQGVVMAIMNVTPDSFSDGGQLLSGETANWDEIYHRAEGFVEAGAGILDIGGESTRPGAAEVSVQQELDRVLPVIERLAARLDCVLSVDTSSPKVMLGAVDAGAGMINDVRALRRDGALAAAVSAHVPVCLMHMQGAPVSMQQAPHYDDVVETVVSFLSERAGAYIAAGGSDQNIIIDPGFGFGKTFEHNVALFKGLHKLSVLNHPVLVGVSRKTMIGHIVGGQPNDRILGSAVAAALAFQSGANIVRVHDVQETMQAKQVIQALGNF